MLACLQVPLWKTLCSPSTLGIQRRLLRRPGRSWHCTLPRARAWEIISMRMGGIWGPLYHSMANLPSRLTHAAVKGTDPDLLQAGVGCRLQKMAATCAT